MPEEIQKLKAHLDGCPDFLVCMTADCLMVGWRESLPEVPAPKLARALLIAFASANTAGRHIVEQVTK